MIYIPGKQQLSLPRTSALLQSMDAERRSFARPNFNVPLYRNLLGRYPLDKSTHFDSTAEVSINRGPIGVPSSTGTPIVSGVFGSALSFRAGNADHIDFASSAFTLSGEATVLAWFNSQGAASNGVVFSDLLNTGSGSFQAEFGRTSGKMGLAWNGTVINAGNTALANNTWHHVAYVRRGVTSAWTAELYIDGVLDKSTSTATNPSSGNRFTIGETSASASQIQPLNGYLHDLWVFNRALLPSEIALVAASKYQPFGLLTPRLSTIRPGTVTPVTTAQGMFFTT